MGFNRRQLWRTKAETKRNQSHLYHCWLQARHTYLLCSLFHHPPAFWLCMFVWMRCAAQRCRGRRCRLLTEARHREQGRNRRGGGVFVVCCRGWERDREETQGRRKGYRHRRGLTACGPRKWWKGGLGMWSQHRRQCAVNLTTGNPLKMWSSSPKCGLRCWWSTVAQMTIIKGFGRLVSAGNCSKNQMILLWSWILNPSFLLWPPKKPGKKK